MSGAITGRAAGPGLDELAKMCATLALPVIHRSAATKAIELGQPVVLARKHAIGRRERRAILGAGWLAVLRWDPKVTDAAVAASRHDALALDLGDLDDGTATRRVADELLEREIGVLVRSHGR
jgi:hypothetical protein